MEPPAGPAATPAAARARKRPREPSARVFYMVTPQGEFILDGHTQMVAFHASTPQQAAHKAFYTAMRTKLKSSPSASTATVGNLAESFVNAVRTRARDVLAAMDPREAEALVEAYLRKCRGVLRERLATETIVYVREKGARFQRGYRCSYRMNDRPNAHELRKQVVIAPIVSHDPLLAPSTG